MTQISRSIKHSLRTLLQQHHSQENLGQWFEPLHLQYDVAEHVLRVDFPHIFFEEWFNAQGRTFFEQAATSFFAAKSTPVHIEYTRKTCTLPSLQFPLRPVKAAFQGEECTIDNFITNKKNAFPLAVVQEISKNTAELRYNPFTVYGKSATGKTHILRALSASLGTVYGNTGVFYGQAPLFVDTVNKLGLDAFSRSYSALMVDDIHLLAHDSAAQELLVQTIDRGLDTGRQMIFSCMLLPSTLHSLLGTLRSRLEAGLLVELKEADLEVRMRFGQARCTQYGVALERDQLLLLAQRCTNLRHLNGVILKIAAFYSLSKGRISTEDIQNILQSSGEDTSLSNENIVRTVCKHLVLQEKDILGSKRQPDLVRARQVSMYLCRELLGTSYPALGRFFGGKDHSTVMHSIKKIKDAVDTDKDMHILVTELKKKCLGR